MLQFRSKRFESSGFTRAPDPHICRLGNQHTIIRASCGLASCKYVIALLPQGTHDPEIATRVSKESRSHLQ